jgi:ketosteroid isomerase-like protein
VIDAGGDDKVLYGTANWSAKGKDKDGKPDLRWHRHAHVRAPSGQLAEN